MKSKNKTSANQGSVDDFLNSIEHKKRNSLAVQIANQFREVQLNGTFIARTNLKDQIGDLSWQQATTKVGSLNTIAALTFHINYYIAGLIHLFEGGELEIRDKFSFDAPPIQSQEDWEQLRDRTWREAERFAELVEQMSEEQLNSIFVKEQYGNYRRNIEAMIEHSYYHLGQIVLLKKIVLGQAGI
ncbi:MAG: DinB family protein [Bacteroidota bacterium]